MAEPISALILSGLVAAFAGGVIALAIITIAALVDAVWDRLNVKADDTLVAVSPEAEAALKREAEKVLKEGEEGVYVFNRNNGKSVFVKGNDKSEELRGKLRVPIKVTG